MNDNIPFNRLRREKVNKTIGTADEKTPVVKPAFYDPLAMNHAVMAKLCIWCKKG